jgi:crossover junction endodeoxyribonuclease RuvC
MNIAAIDPGLRGAIAVYYQQQVSAYPLPVIGDEVDLVTLADWIKGWNLSLIAIEKVHSMPNQGVRSMFSFGKHYGGLLGIAAALKIPVRLVQSQQWKKLVLCGTAKDKAAAIAYCRRVFPNVNLVLPRCRVPHDGMADALCILEWARAQKFLD